MYQHIWVGDSEKSKGLLLFSSKFTKLGLDVQRCLDVLGKDVDEVRESAIVLMMLLKEINDFFLYNKPEGSEFSKFFNTEDCDKDLEKLILQEMILLQSAHGAFCKSVSLLLADRQGKAFLVDEMMEKVKDFKHLIRKRGKELLPLLRGRFLDFFDKIVYAQENILRIVDETHHENAVLIKANAALAQLDRDATLESDRDHHELTVKVHKRLLQRHAILAQVEALARGHASPDNDDTGMLCPHGRSCSSGREGKSDQAGTDLGGAQACRGACQGNAPGTSCKCSPYIVLPRTLRAYNLAVTDLFVEKVLAYLRDHANPYRANYKVFLRLAFLVLGSTALISVYNFFWLSCSVKVDNAYDFVSTLVRGFTMYGLLVFFWRKIAICRAVVSRAI